MSDIKSDLKTIVEQSVKVALNTSGMNNLVKTPNAVPSNPRLKPVLSIPKLKEALIALPRSFLLKTDKLSARTKEAHEILYKKYVEAFNKVSADADSANKEEASNHSGAFRNLKENECYNLNSIKLHELYFTNISDLSSEVTVDSIPYIKLSRFFGTFDKWQQDFIGCCLTSREGWAMTVYEPYKDCYMNIMVDGHSSNVPVGAIPIIVIDMWAHSYFKDYANDKKSYVVNMMRELNWNVVEARMMVAEQSSLKSIYKIAPIVNGEPEIMVADSAAHAEPVPVQPVNNGIKGSIASSSVFNPSPTDKRIP